MNITALLIYVLGVFQSFLPNPTYTEGVVDQPKSFLPSTSRSQHEKTVSKLIYRGLFKYDIYGTLVPDLAETWEISEDGLVYTIRIKEGVKWSDGRNIISDDIIYTASKMPGLEGVATDKVDEFSIRFILPNRYAPFLSLLTEGVMPVNTQEKGNPLMPVSNSDYRVVRVDKNGNLVRKIFLLTDKPQYKIKRLVFRYYSNEDELVSAGKLGEIDGFLAERAHEGRLANFSNLKFPLQGIYYAIYFNLSNENVKDVEFRKKLSKALPLDQVIYDRGIKVQGSISRSAFTDRDLKFETYDPVFKEDMADKSIKLTIPDTEKHVELAQRLAEFWSQKLDLDTNIIKVNPTEFVANVIEPRNYEVMLYGQEIGRDPDRYVNWHSTQKDPPGLNLTGFEHVRADRALEEGRNELDNTKRVVHYNEFQKVVVDNTPVIFLYHPFTNYYISNYIKGIGEKYTFSYTDRFLDLYNWERVQTN